MLSHTHTYIYIYITTTSWIYRNEKCKLTSSRASLYWQVPCFHTYTHTRIYIYYIYIYIFMLVSDFQIYTPTHTHIFMLYQKDKNDLPKESCPATSFSLVIHWWERGNQRYTISFFLRTYNIWNIFFNPFQ